MNNRTFPKPPSTFPKPPSQPEQTSDRSLNESEMSFILRTTLAPQHHQDPTVLLFIRELLRTNNVSDAAYAASISYDSAQNLRSRKDIHLAITKIREAAVMKYGFDSEELVQGVKSIADVDPLDIYKEDGTIKSMREMKPEVRRSIRRFKVKQLWERDPNGMRVQAGETIEIEFWDKQKAQEMLGREKGNFKETKVIEHEVTKNMKDLLLASRDRAERLVGEVLEIEGGRGEEAEKVQMRDVGEHVYSNVRVEKE